MGVFLSRATPLPLLLLLLLHPPAPHIHRSSSAHIFVSEALNSNDVFAGACTPPHQSVHVCKSDGGRIHPELIPAHPLCFHSLFQACLHSPFSLESLRCPRIFPLIFRFPPKIKFLPVPVYCRHLSGMTVARLGSNNGPNPAIIPHTVRWLLTSSCFQKGKSTRLCLVLLLYLPIRWEKDPCRKFHTARFNVDQCLRDICPLNRK